MFLADLGKALTEQIALLKPAQLPPNGVVEHELVTLDRTEKDNSKWLSIISEKLQAAKTFKIHCWEDEAEQIALALKYGEPEASDWHGGKVIAGAVTPEFAQMLLTLPKPADTEIYNKMTPFFDVWLDDRFQSCHYGTEIYL